jgi:uncharacterized protein (TIGR02145 family)
LSHNRIIGLLICLATVPSTAQPPGDVNQANHPTFIENKGQIIDQNNRPNPAVLYLLNTPGMNVQLRRGGFSYDLYRISNIDQRISNDELANNSLQSQQSGTRDPASNIEHPTSNIEYHRIDFDLLGSNPNCEIITTGTSSDYTNYYTSGTSVEGVTNVHFYKTVTYKNIYPGIDLQFISSDEIPFKYNFVVHPGGKTSAIKIKISGPEEIRVIEEGLLFNTSLGMVEEKIPQSFFLVNNTKTEIRSFYRQIKENIYGISINRGVPGDATLTIDPVPARLWGTYYGGTGASPDGNDMTSCCTLDEDGNLVIAGYTSAFNNIATTGSYQSTYNDGDDTYLAKFTPDGVRIWGTYYGGEQMDWTTACVTDNDNNIFITGYTMSETIMASPGAYQPSLNSSGDAFIAKFNSIGFRIWGTYYGGTDTEWGHSIAIDPQGNLYIAGETESATNMASPGAFQTTIGGGQDAYLAKFDSTGQRIWGTYYGGTGTDQGRNCSIDANGHLLLAGYTESSANIATPGAHQTVFNGILPDGDGFLVLFNPAGQRQWGTYYGGTKQDFGKWCYTTNTGKIYLLGHSYSTNNIATPSSYQPVLAGYCNNFIAKFNLEGVREWGTYFGSTGGNFIAGADYDPRGALFLCGHTNSSYNFTSPNAYQTTFLGNWEGYLAKFDTSGFRDWCTYYGGTGWDFTNGVAVDTNDRQYIVGQTSSLTGFATPGAHQFDQGGGTWDGYVAKLTDCKNPSPEPISGPSSVCYNSTGIVYSIPAIPKVTSYVWSVPPGATITGGQNTHSITVDFSTSVSAGEISIYAINHCGIGDTVRLLITPFPPPVPVITGNDNLCLGTSAVYKTQKLMTNYQWSVSSGGTIISGGSPNDSTATISWISTGWQWVQTNFTDAIGCTASDPVQLDVFVFPGTALTNNPLYKSICSGDSTRIILTASQPGATFTWTATGSSINVSGYTGGSGQTINQKLVNTGSNPETVTYSITPYYGGCFGLTVDFIVTVNPILPVSIMVSPSANPVCAGTSVTFTAIPTNGGTTPVYQWKLNGVNTGANSPNFTITPSNGDFVTCTLTSSETCTTGNPATSNQVTMTVDPILPVIVSISASANPFCIGSPVTFTASPTNGGTTPQYQWQVNGGNVGTNNPVYSYIPASLDLVFCILTSSEPCPTGNPDTSNTITMIANLSFPAGVSIVASPNPFCPGSLVMFTATPGNGGPTPSYQWKVNGANAGTNSPIFTYNPANNDSVRCVMTSNLACVSNNPVWSNRIIMVSSPVPVVTFTACFDTITTTNAKPIKLKGGIPLGGSYTGPGVNSMTGVFTPSIAGTGTKAITYTYTNAALCSASKSRNILVVVAPAFTCGNNMVDIRDNKVYPTVLIGGQCWMAANLDFGVQISELTHQRDNCISEKYTSFVPAPSSFYQWDEIMRYDPTPASQGLCPPGWHVPAEAEWGTLFANWTNNAFAASPLKYSGYSGFNALLSGARHENVQWNYQNFAVFFWSSTSHGPFKAWAHGMNDYDPSVSFYPSLRSNAFSVRCIRD